MTTTITFLQRGGWSAHGSARYDARENAVMLPITEDETRAISVKLPSAISTVTEEENGITSTTPSISSATFTATLSDMTDAGRIEYVITLSAGEVHRLCIIATRRDLWRGSDYGR